MGRLRFVPQPRTSSISKLAVPLCPNNGTSRECAGLLVVPWQCPLDEHGAPPGRIPKLTVVAAENMVNNTVLLSLADLVTGRVVGQHGSANHRYFVWACRHGMAGPSMRGRCNDDGKDPLRYIRLPWLTLVEASPKRQPPPSNSLPAHSSSLSRSKLSKAPFLVSTLSNPWHLLVTLSPSLCRVTAECCHCA